MESVLLNLLMSDTVSLYENFLLIPQADPFGGDPFKETDPFKTMSEDFFKRPAKADPFTSSDPFSKSATLPVKVMTQPWKGVQRWWAIQSKIQSEYFRAVRCAS